jgi:hypothetical protein
MLRRVALVKTDVSEELGASFIRMARISELGTTLAVTSNLRTLRKNTNCFYWPNCKEERLKNCMKRGDITYLFQEMIK